jgi:N-acetylneuraminic acid mutarotase
MKAMRTVRPMLLLLAVAALAAAAPAPASAQETWTATSTEGAPTARASHTAVWTGSRMIVWGGQNIFDGGGLGTGGVYEPGSRAWTPTRTVGAPSARDSHTAVWTGSRMVAWGGVERRPSWTPLDTGGSYDPETDSWTATSRRGAPAPRQRHTAVWTGSRMIVWGGGAAGWPLTPCFDDGAVYDPATDTWAPLGRNGAPSARFDHTAVWTGSTMIVWGGADENGMRGDGAAYDPATDSWRPLVAPGAPSARARHTAVWTGSRMIVWGGQGTGYETLATGALYDPRTDSWEPTSITAAPERRLGHTAIWTGSRMVVWGGSWADRPHTFSTGGVFDPATQTWTPTPDQDAPGQRTAHTAVWNGWQMIVWGGVKTETTHYYLSGGAFAPGLETPATDFYTVTPCRVVDTRDPYRPVGGPRLDGKETRRFRVVNRACGIPAEAVAVSVNLTAAGGAAPGFLTLFPGDGAGPPLARTVTFSAGEIRGSSAVAALASDGTGTLSVKNGSAAPVDVILDVNGYFR